LGRHGTFIARQSRPISAGSRALVSPGTNRPVTPLFVAEGWRPRHIRV